MRKIFYILFAIALFVTSCKHNHNDKEIKTYYDTGELGAIITKLNDSISTFKSYYKNGNPEIVEGYYKRLTDSTMIRTGRWICYLSDGKFYFDCEFDSKSRAIIPVNDSVWDKIGTDENPFTVYLEVETEQPLYSRLKKGQRYYFRVVVPELNPHPDFLYVCDSSYVEIEKNSDNQSAFPYTIKPEKSGRFLVHVMFAEKNGMCIIGKRTFSFEFEVQ